TEFEGVGQLVGADAAVGGSRNLLRDVGDDVQVVVEFQETVEQVLRKGGVDRGIDEGRVEGADVVIERKPQGLVSRELRALVGRRPTTARRNENSDRPQGGKDYTYSENVRGLLDAAEASAVASSPRSAARTTRFTKPTPAASVAVIRRPVSISSSPSFRGRVLKTGGMIVIGMMPSRT